MRQPHFLSPFPLVSSGVNTPFLAYSLGLFVKLFGLSINVVSSLAFNQQDVGLSLSSSPRRRPASDGRHLWSVVSAGAAKAHRSFAQRVDVPGAKMMTSTQLLSAAHKSH